MDSGGEISGELVAAGGHGAEVFDPTRFAFAAELEVAVPQGLAIGPWRNHRVICRTVRRSLDGISRLKGSLARQV